MNGIYNNISPVINTAPQAWIDQQTLRGIGSNRSRLYVDPMGDLWGQFENNPPKKIANLGGTGSSSSTGVPVGAVFQWIGAVAPAGYIMCDGNAVSGMYPKLLALLTSYGGKTPDLRGRFVIGASTTSPSYTNSFPGPLQLMANGGNFETTLDLQHLPEHSHEIEEEAAASHTHLFDVPDHTHSVTTQTLTGHSHAVDSPDATVTHWTGSAWDSQGNDGSTGDNDTWEPSFDSATWTNSLEDSDGGDFYISTDTVSDGTDWSDKPTFSADADTTTGGPTFSGTPAAASAGAITNRETDDGGAIDYNTTDGGYHDHLTSQDDSAVADGDPDSYSGDGGIDLDTHTTDWTTKPDFSVDADTTTGGATFSGTPAAASAGAITDRATDNGGAIDFTTTDGGYHDHLTSQDDSAVADGDPDSYSGDGGIDLDTHTTDWGTKPDFSVDADTTTGGASYPNTPVAATGGSVQNRATNDGGAIDYTTIDGGYHDHLVTQDDSAVADGDPDSYSGDGGIDLDITDTTWTDRPTVNLDGTTADATVTDADFTGNSVAHTHGSGAYDAYWTTDGLVYKIEAYWDDGGGNWFGVVSSDDSMNSADGDNFYHDVGGSAELTTLTPDGDVQVAVDVDIDAEGAMDENNWEHDHHFDLPFSRGTHSHNIDIEGHAHTFDIPAHGHALVNLAHTHDIDGIDVSADNNNWDHTHHFDIPFSRGTHSHDIDIEGHAHTFDIPSHVHALVNLAHTHDIDGIDVSADSNNWDHTHHFDIPFSRGTHIHDIDIEGHTHTFDIPSHVHSVVNLDHTHDIDGLDVEADENNWEHSHKTSIDSLHHTHALTDTAHYHSFDIDLQASTSSVNNGVSWVEPMGASGTAATAGGVTDRETSEAQEAAHAHGGRTGNAGLSTPDPVQSLPPYIALNFIIKHD